MLTEHKRIKHGQLPGDINRGWKIAMLENRQGEYELPIFPWHVLDERDAKTFRRGIRERGRAVQRQRDQRVIRAQLTEV